MPDYKAILDADFGGEGNPLHPYDPVCKRYASEIDEWDPFIMMPEGPDEEPPSGPVTPEMREEYVMTEEGTYNPLNGHFTCTKCYIKIGMPSGPGGWRCP